MWRAVILFADPKRFTATDFHEFSWRSWPGIFTGNRAWPSGFENDVSGYRGKVLGTKTVKRNALSRVERREKRNALNVIPVVVVTRI
jgi:hypothetical protein